MDNNKPEKLLIGSVACDWLTLTTSTREGREYMWDYSDYCAEGGGTPVPQRRMQFRGMHNADSGLYVGDAIIDGKTWTMLQCSGFGSTDHLADLSARDWTPNCKRMDVQITVGDDGTRLDSLLVANSWRDEESHSCSVYHGAAGDTVYIGSRTSNLFLRAYQKTESHVRYEFEIKGGMAKLCWDKVAKTRGDLDRIKAALAAIWIEAIERMVPWQYRTLFPELYEAVNIADNQSMGESVGLVLERKKTDTVRWLHEQVLPAYRKLINSHDSADVRDATIWGRLIADALPARLP